MNTFLYYLIQVIVASGILYLYYHIALRNRKFHQYNRFYLLAAAVVSMIVPFFNIPVYFTQQETASSVVLRTLTVISSPVTEVTVAAPDPDPAISATTFTFTLTDILYCIYAVLAVLALVKIVLSLLRIRKLKQNNPAEKIDTISFINTSEPGTPFSFFRWLFWNKNIELRSEKGQQIFRHELFHIQQKHSIDLLFMELLTVIFWINPFSYLMKKELRAIHEFLADQFAVNRTDKWEYAELLLMQALQTKHSLVNPFFHNQIKRRIAMITSPQKTSYRYLRKLMVLPVIILITALFAFSYKSMDITHTVSGTVIFPEKIDPEPQYEKQIRDLPQQSDSLLYLGKILRTGYTNADPTKPIFAPRPAPSFPRIGSYEWNMYFFQNLNPMIPIQEGWKPGIYNLFIHFTIDEKGFISETEVINYPNSQTAAHCLQLISKLSRSQHLLKSSKGKVQYYQPIAFKIVAPVDTPKQEKRQFHFADGPPASLIIMDGKRIDNKILEDKSIASTGFKSYRENDPEAIRLYGKDAANGVMVFKDAELIDRLFSAYTDVDSKPSFPGGQTAWGKYLRETIDADVPLKNNAPPGTYRVRLYYEVDKEGNLINLVPIGKKHGYGMEEEAMRVMKVGPKWIPAKRNGKNVIAYYNQYFTFKVLPKNAYNQRISEAMKIPDHLKLTAGLTLQIYSGVTNVFPSMKDEEEIKAIAAVAEKEHNSTHLTDKEIIATLTGIF